MFLYGNGIHLQPRRPRLNSKQHITVICVNRVNYTPFNFFHISMFCCTEYAFIWKRNKISIFNPCLCCVI